MIKVKMNRKTRQVLIEGKGRHFFENGIKEALGDIGKLVQKETQKGIINPPKTGRRYGKHQASVNRSRKEYPANETGKLERSINFSVQSSRKMIVGSNVPHGLWLEDGTSKMEPRKLLGTTIEKNKNKIRDIIRKRVDAELKR